ncbi:MAG: S9 family peptidase [Actinomycetota bacterium]
MNAPRPVKKPVEITTHGDTRVDGYGWLRNADDPDVIAHLEAENAHTEASLAHVASLRDELYSEIIGRIQETDSTYPVPSGDFQYYSRTVEGGQYRIHCRRKGADGPEQILVDLNEMSEGGYISLGILEPSPNHQVLAYAIDRDGSEYYTLRFKDLDSGEDLEDVIEKVATALAWSADGETVLYTTMDHAHRPYRVWAHRLGEPVTEDLMLFEEPDERFYVGVGESRDRRWAVIHIGSPLTGEARFASTDDITSFRLVRERAEGTDYECEFAGDRIYIRTDDGAPEYRLMEASVKEPGDWRELIPGRQDVKISGVDAFARHRVITERAQGLIRLRVIGSDGQDRIVPMPEDAYEVSMGPNESFETSKVRIVYTSMTTPRSDYELDLDSLELKLLKEDPVLGDYDRSRYVTERLFATAADGTQVPMSVVYRRGIKRPGPLVLYGYGSYGASIPAAFSLARISLLDRGITWVIAHIRGGGELGEAWRNAGKFLKKKTTFTDFIACADHLVHAGFTTREQLAIMGGSAGGLLMGAVMNERPDLCRAVVAQVPFVDSLNTMLDESLPLTVIEYEEWGSPKDPTYYEYMKSYAPYENIHEAAYPDVLATGGLTDPRVGFWEPTKWVARLREHATNDPVILLKMQMGAGHGGPAGRYDAFKEVALTYAFILDRIAAAD